MKKKSVTKLKKELMLLVKQAIKERDNFTCQFCGLKVEGSNCHASHVIPVSAGNRLAFDPLNLKVLCYHHHINFFHKNPIEAGQWFTNKFPERWEYLKAHRNEIVHWKEADYLRMIEEMKDAIL